MIRGKYKSGDLRRKAGAIVVDNFFRGLSHAARKTPHARNALDEIRILRNVPYMGGPAAAAHHRLDIYLPNAEPPYPAMLYIHGGGFRILSKDTHWVMALGFARKGFAVFNMNYRLAPEHPFPAGIEDVFAAWKWVHENAPLFGVSTAPVVVAGESAGANLATALTLATTHRHAWEPAAATFELGHTPAAVIAACGMLQVSDCARFGRRKPLPVWLTDRLHEVEEPYLSSIDVDDPRIDFADPLCALERTETLDRPSPPMMAFVGTKDPLIDDTRRLKAAMDRHGAECDLRIYPGEVHAFHAFLWRQQARECWRHQYRFLERHTGASP